MQFKVLISTRAVVITSLCSHNTVSHTYKLAFVGIERLGVGMNPVEKVDYFARLAHRQVTLQLERVVNHSAIRVGP